jgi:hypothetical protein
MPFCCGKRSADICIVLGPEKLLNVFQRMPPAGFSNQRPRICRQLTTKDDSDRSLAGRQHIIVRYDAMLEPKVVEPQIQEKRGGMASGCASLIYRLKESTILSGSIHSGWLAS